MAKVKKTKVEKSEKMKKLEAIRDSVNKQFKNLKEPPVQIMVKGQKRKMDFISTGSLQLDLALGVGGIPVGRIIEIYGPEASGKTTLTLHMAAECQKKGGVVAFIDAEHALDPAYAEAIGLNMSEVLLVQPDYGEQALEIADLLADEGVDLIIIDSVAALTPQAELEGTMENQQMGAQARMMAKGLRKIVAKVNKSKSTIVFINQIRMKIGVMFGSPETTSGGNALKYAASVRLDVRRVKSKSSSVDHKVEGVMKVKIVKNKVAVPFREVMVPIVYGVGINQTEEVYEIAKEVVELFETSGGSHFYIGKPITLSQPIEVNGGNIELPGLERSIENKFASKRDDALKLIKEDKAFFEAVREQVLERLLLLSEGKTWKKEEEPEETTEE